MSIDVRAKYDKDVVYNKRNIVVKVLCYKSEGRWFDPR